ncbi:nitrilase-related carbon-nitrogen hydrolase [Roseinatronobacter monicus]|uniref:Putative amidohydrolase n=1 Tax=Roseinatronobacter monicus TaxID=393481 RepID=A0A543KHF5_9RHOB|nr:nitrilase-related carbon-nitrogen hydrolase [Roseinatronobacter monicus]TQM94511.1 putative amidohydrolase [Roseinatronobacter monicus]
MKVGIAQFASDPTDLEANFEMHREWIAQARAAGVAFLLLPELSLTGHYGAMRLLDFAMPRTDPRLIALSELAGDMTICPGFIEEGPAAQFYNTTAVLRAGELVTLHRKINLPNYRLLEEGKHYASGRFVDTWALDDQWRLGLMICADAWNPALVHLACLHGATLLACPASSGIEAVGEEFDNPAGWARTMEFYSVMYGLPSMMANRTGREADLTFWGGSRILDPFGKLLAIAGAEPELITATLDYGALRRARHALPTVRDSNIALIHRETARLIDSLGVPDVVRRP